MNILVTGATGFIGPNVARALVQRGHQVRCLVRRGADLRPLQYLPVEVWLGDILDPATLPPALEDQQAVVHLVGILKERPPALTYQRVHVEGTRNLAEAAKAAGVQRFLYMSGNGAADSPKYPYLHTKWQAEELVKASGIPWTVLRPSIVTGPGDGFFNQLADIVRHPPSGGRTMAPVVPVIGSGGCRYSPIHVEDLARCTAQAAVDPAFAGRTVVLGGPEQFTYRELLRLTMDTIKVHRPVVPLPVWFMRLVVPTMPLLYKDPPLTPALLEMALLDNVAEPDSVLANFGFEPRAIGEHLGYLTANP